MLKPGEKAYTIVLILFALFGIISAVWFLPQKWEACGKLYSNGLAQWMCFSSN
jgi:hypothetical protein